LTVCKANVRRPTRRARQTRSTEGAVYDEFDGFGEAKIALLLLEREEKLAAFPVINDNRKSENPPGTIRPNGVSLFGKEKKIRRMYSN